MRKHEKDSILEFETVDGNLYTGCRGGMIVDNKDSYAVKTVIEKTDNLVYSFENFNVNKLKTYKNKEVTVVSNNTVKVGWGYYNAFRLYALLSKVGYTKGLVEIYNRKGSHDYPIRIKAMGKEMLLAPIILEDVCNRSESYQEQIYSIVDIEVFRKK